MVVVEEEKSGFFLLLARDRYGLFFCLFFFAYETDRWSYDLTIIRYGHADFLLYFLPFSLLNDIIIK